MDDMNATAIATLDFSLFVYNSDLLAFDSSFVNTVSTYLMSDGDMIMDNTKINTSARACLTNTGIGRGTTIQYQNTYCTSGSSSCGYGTLSDSELCSDIVQYFTFLSHSFPYMNKGPYLSTGSGGYGYNLGESGAGGGIIFIMIK